MPIGDEIRYRIFSVLASNPGISQRELAAHLGVSVGKVNYCLNALIERGFLKVRNFRNSSNKAAYAYMLTPRGSKEKAQVTLRFLRARIEEYELLTAEIARLREESQGLGATAGFSEARHTVHGSTAD